MKLILFIYILILPSLAFAEWNTAFPTESTKTHFTNKALIMVVSVDADSAALALKNALGDRALDGGALGKVATLSDEAIIKKASSQPVTQIAIVRISGEMAIVTIYKKDGSSVGGFTASEGVPVAEADHKEGASEKEYHAVKKVIPKAKDPTEAREKFLNNYVGFQDWIGVNQYGGIVAKWSTPFKGRDRKELDGSDFYREIGQPDLADAYDSANTKRNIVGISAFAISAAGFIYALTSQSDQYSGTENPHKYGTADFKQYETSAEEELASNDTKNWIGLGVGLLGLLVGGNVYLLWNPHPVDPPEARRLAREHNKKLAEELGINVEQFEQAALPKAEPTPTQLRLGIAPSRSGGSVQIGFTF